MTATTPAPRRVLFVGAYERDNFGDLLFLLVSEQYLAEAGYDVVAAAPLAADMSDLLDRKVDAFVPRLEQERFDQVWTVGGEVGATGVSTAIWMSVPSATYRRYKAASEPEQAAMRAELLGATDIESPYMPRLSQFPLNAGVPAVLNSVGVAGIKGKDPARREVLLRILREASAVSVRDHLSSELLAEHDVAHTLVPDVVHTIRYTHPRPEGEQGSGAALVQANRKFLAQHGIEKVAEALVASSALAPYPLRLFAAGLAPNHDSFGDYAKIVAAVRRLDPERDIEVLRGSRRPWDLVDEIRRASLWIGGSLHGRIVSAAYDVPRLSLPKRKLDAYARTWDPHMPYGTTLDSLDADVRRALSPETRAAAADTGERLAALADANIRAAIARARAATPEETTARRFEAAQQAIADRDRRAQEVEAELTRRLTALESESLASVVARRGRAEARSALRPARRVAGRVVRKVRSARDARD
ncbi:polysaccharide pyruvyl transferase family protein [Isoptericola sp. NPDC057391]|uniref:polysaccharide pyruvyl transferase family protein n=1 Tax=Isoptericola sp. NPDC057391 TaxID=3346117 RepID=UPI00363B586D